MFTVAVQVKEDDKTIQGIDYKFNTEDEVKSFITGLEELRTDARTPAGRIVTPLPPDLIHSSKGIVMPKSPVQVAREQRKRTADIPQEFKDDDYEL